MASLITPDVTTCPTLAAAMFVLTIPNAGIFAGSSESASATCGVSPLLLPVKYTASPLASVTPVLLYTSIVTAPFRSPSKKPVVVISPDVVIVFEPNPFARKSATCTLP